MAGIEISVIIPTYNRVGILRRCLRSLAKQTLEPDRYEVIVVDDGSTDGTRELLARGPKGLQLRSFFVDHGGPSRARNYGAAAARGRVLLFLGDDMLADPGLVQSHLWLHQRWPDDHVGVVGHIEWSAELPDTPIMRYLREPSTTLQFDYGGIDAQNAAFGRMYGSNHSVKRALFERVGGLDESFSEAAWDDVELEFRYREVGFRLLYARGATVAHHHCYDFEQFARRMLRVGRAAYQLYKKHPETARLTDLGSLLARQVPEHTLEAGLELAAQYEANPRPDGRPRWTHMLMNWAASGAQEAARCDGWTDPVEALAKPTADGGGPLSIVFDASSAGDQMPGVPALRVGLNGDCRKDKVWGRACYRIGSANGQHGSLGFTLTGPRPAGRSVRLQVHYLNLGATRWQIEYDGLRQTSNDTLGQSANLCTTRPITNTDTGDWRTAEFDLEDWFFRGRCHGYDFRITVIGEPEPPLTVSRTELEFPGIERLADPGLKLEGWPEGLDPVTFEVTGDPEISIIIPAHGEIRRTSACLKALRDATLGAYEVIVVDNGSTDGTGEYLSRCRGIRVLSRDDNMPFARVCNEAAQVARGTYLAFLNNDTLALPGWLSCMVASMKDDAGIAVVGAKLLYPQERRIQHAGLSLDDTGELLHHHRGAPFAAAEVSHAGPQLAVTGAALLVGREDFLTVGGFDERYRNGFEDVDLCLRFACANFSGVRLNDLSSKQAVCLSGPENVVRARERPVPF